MALLSAPPTSHLRGPKLIEKQALWAKSTKGTFLVVIWAKKVNEVFERFSRSGACPSHREWWAVPQSEPAEQHVQVATLGLFSDPGMIRNVTHRGGCDP